MYLFAFINQHNATFVSAFHNDDGDKIQKEGYCATMLDCMHPHHFFEIVKDIQNPIWIKEALHKR